MAGSLLVISTPSELRRTIAQYRRAGEGVALVPTMGALHDGHLALVRTGRSHARRVVVSIFVNPAQFAPSEDFAAYPRGLDADMAALAGTGADVVYAPDQTTMYPDGFATRVVPGGAAVVGLEDAFRPDFFAGVATVVTKLLLQCLPDVAIFGEKDYQQLRVVSGLVADLNIPVTIVGVPTERADDGLALSSRNAYLSPEQRNRAPTLYRVLELCARKIAATGHLQAILSEGREVLERAGFELDYLEARDPDTLLPVAGEDVRSARLLVAARLGPTRLIDNIGVRD